MRACPLNFRGGLRPAQKDFHDRRERFPCGRRTGRRRPSVSGSARSEARARLPFPGKNLRRKFLRQNLAQKRHTRFCSDAGCRCRRARQAQTRLPAQKNRDDGRRQRGTPCARPRCGNDRQNPRRQGDSEEDRKNQRRQHGRPRQEGCCPGCRGSRAGGRNGRRQPACRLPRRNCGARQKPRTGQGRRHRRRSDGKRSNAPRVARRARRSSHGTCRRGRIPQEGAPHGNGPCITQPQARRSARPCGVLSGHRHGRCACRPLAACRRGRSAPC